jgi:hypothetical protein
MVSPIGQQKGWEVKNLSTSLYLINIFNK